MDDSKITFGLKLGGLAISIGGISVFWNKIKQILFWNFSIKIWQGCIFLLLASLILWISVKFLKKEESFGIDENSREPDNLVKDYGTKEIHKVLWKIWDGEYYGPSFDTETALWIEGPLCPKCRCKLFRDKNKWICPKCLRKITIPKEIRKSLNSKIRTIIEADMRSDV